MYIFTNAKHKNMFEKNCCSAHILERVLLPLQIQNSVENTAVKTNLYSSLSFNVFPID